MNANAGKATSAPFVLFNGLSRIPPDGAPVNSCCCKDGAWGCEGIRESRRGFGRVDVDAVGVCEERDDCAGECADDGGCENRAWADDAGGDVACVAMMLRCCL